MDDPLLRWAKPSKPRRLRASEMQAHIDKLEQSLVDCEKSRVTHLYRVLELVDVIDSAKSELEGRGLSLISLDEYCA